MRMWRQLSLFVALPAVGLCMLNAYLGIRDHPHERPEFVPYEHMRIHIKVFAFFLSWNEFKANEAFCFSNSIRGSPGAMATTPSFTTRT